jgi:hypothetical protein
MRCRHDTNEGFSVRWDTNGDFKSYTEFSGLTTRAVQEKHYFAVSTSGVCFIGPNSDQAPFDAGIHSTVRVNLRIETEDVNPPTTARIQFQTEDDPSYNAEKIVDFPIVANGAYNEYAVDMSTVQLWQGNIIRMRVYPFIDGAPGNLVHLKSLRVTAPTIFSCSTSFDGPLCSRFSDYVHPCPWTGAGGSCEGVRVEDGINITEGVNDRLVVNINEYGAHAITLAPVKGARLKDIARDIEEKLSNVGIAGYAGNKVEVSFNKLKIIADDTRESTSSVTVLDTMAARLLGFYDVSGNDVAYCSVGEDAASRFDTSGTIQLSKAEIANLYVDDVQFDNKGLKLDPREYAVQAGRVDYAEVYKDKKIDSSGKTIIEFNRPITNNGTIVTVSYSGDGTADTKVVFLRPKSNGTMVQFASESFGLTSTKIDNVFHKQLSVKVRKGDFIGLYDCKVDVGKIEELPNVSYFLYDGETSDGQLLPPQEIVGKGDSGLRLFARGYDLQSEVVLDIEFEQQEPIETIQIVAEEEVRQERINLTRTLGGGVNGGPVVTGETGVDKFGAPAPSLADLGAVTDGITFVEAGADALHPSWLDTTFTPADKFDQTEFSVVLDFAKGIPVFFNIDQVIVYFRDPNNVKYFSIEYPLTTNEFDTDRYWGPVTDKHNLVRLEGKPLLPDTHPLYNNPIHVTAEDFLDSFQVLEYRMLDLSFNPVRARSIRFNVKNFFLNEDETSPELSNFKLAPSPYLMEIEAYAGSTPVASISDNYSFESSIDGARFVEHDNVTIEGETSASYLIGYPVKYLRLRIKPQGSLETKGTNVSLSRARDKLLSVDDSFSVSLDTPSDDYASTINFDVVNKDDQTNSYYIDIASQRNKVDRCILWNKLGSALELSTSELGPSPYLLKREDYYPREYNYALNMPAYAIDPFWLLNQRVPSYISYDGGSKWGARGTTVTDYSLETVLTAESANYETEQFVYLVIDLGDVLYLENILVFTPPSKTAWTGPLYSSKNVSDPAGLDVINDFVGVKENARWLRFRAFSKEVGDSGAAHLGYIKALLDPSKPQNRRKVYWVGVPKLTNYVLGTTDDVSCGEGWQCDENNVTFYYAVNLTEEREVSNIITGPQNSNVLGDIDDYDLVEPGAFVSLFSPTSRSNADVTFSSTATNDPNDVFWGNFGDEADGKVRWILLRKSDRIIDEVVVHIKDNVNEDKPSFGSAAWWSSASGRSVVNDTDNYIEAPHSISIEYPSTYGPTAETIEVQQSFGIDDTLSKRDQLRLFIFISDITQLDTTKGYIAVGRAVGEDNGGTRPLLNSEPDENNYYKWNISDMQYILVSGWNEVLLPFSDNFKIGEPNLTFDNFASMSAVSISGKSRLRWLRVQFSGVENNTAFRVNVDSIKIVRGTFVPARFGNGVYLSRDEYLKFPLNNVNVFEGTLEFFLNPDWSKDRGCFTCDDPRDHTIFRLFNSDNYNIAAIMTGDGLKLYLTDGLQHYTLTDNSGVPITIGTNTHLAFVWDVLGNRSSDALKIYINGVQSASLPKEVVAGADIKSNSRGTLLIGGIGWDGLVSPLATSVNGVVDNLKVYNYAISDFKQSLIDQRFINPVPSEEMIEISLNGVDFFGSGDRGSFLPLFISDVSPSTSFRVYVKRKQGVPVTEAAGQERNSFIKIIKARTE